MSAPIVSIVLPTYNRAELLPRAIESICAQTFSDWRIILVDDGSTDDTPRIAERYQARLGDRITCIRKANTGCGGARNRGIDAATGRYVAFLDSDDEFLPHKLARQLELFALRPELGLVYSDYAFVDTDGRRHESAFDTVLPMARRVAFDRVGDRLCVCRSGFFDVLLREYFIATIVGMVRRDVLTDTIRWAPDPSYSAEWLFYLKVAHRTPAGFVDEPLCLHHHVKLSVTRTDAQRNTLRLHALLHEMKRSLTALNRAQRRVVDRRLAGVCRQLGHDNFRTGNFTASCGHYLEALAYEPRLRTLANALEAWLRARREPKPTKELEVLP